MKHLLRSVVWMVLLSGLASHAAVTPIRFYHLGEDDAGVGHAVIATNSIDSVSTNALTLTGTPKYWAHAARGNTNSTYSILFSQYDQGTAAVVTNTDNVCLEAWANTGARPSHVVAYNGSSAANGYGFILTNSSYLAILGGVGTVATIPCPVGFWMHLALVCSNGVVAVFTNGTLAAVTNATPVPPTGNLFIGGPNVGNTWISPEYSTTPVPSASDMMHGFVDDVRISTFASGGFKPTDLLYAPAPQTQLSIARNGDNVVVAVPANGTLVKLQFTTNLTSPNWQPVDAAEVLALEQARSNSISGDALYFRLNPTASSPVPAVMITGDSFPENTLILSQGAPSVVVDPLSGSPEYTIPGNDLDGTADNGFDASCCVDPLTDATNTLSYHWIVFASAFNEGGRPYGGLADYHSSALQLDANSLPQLNAPAHPQPNDNSLYWRVALELHHIPYSPYAGQETVFWFRFRYLFSSYAIQLVPPGDWNAPGP